MQLQHLLATFADYDNGNKRIRNGIIKAFLYKRKWYPLHALVNDALILANGTYKEKNVYHCHSILADLLPYFLRTKDIDFNNNGFPVPITDAEALSEIQLINDVLDSFF